MGINKSSIYNLSSITKIKGVFSSFNIVLRVVSLEEFYKLKYCSTVVYMVPRA